MFRSGSATLFSLFTALVLLSAATLASAEDCARGVRDLEKSYDVVQGKGGLWGFLEQTGGLKDKSVIGLQADSKIQRGLSILRERCKEGKALDMEVYNALQDVIGDARMVFNMSERTPAAKILEAVTQVGQKADQVLASLGQ